MSLAFQPAPLTRNRNPSHRLHFFSQNGLRRSAGAALLLAMAAGTALASSHDRLTAADRLTGADLIVQGLVTKVEHRNSDVISPDHVSLPHTFVTLAVERVFKGAPAGGSTLTLRMQGGPNGNGLTLRVSGVPQFRVGDRDILFVKGNGSELCPLVGFDQGRLRVVRGEVYNDLGQEVWITAAGDFAFGEVKIDVDEPSYPALVRAAGEVEPRPEFVPPAGAIRPDLIGFDVLLEGMLVQAAAKGLLKQVPLTASATIDQPFHVLALAPAAAPVDAAPAEVPHFQGAFDAAEAELLEKSSPASKSKN